MCKFGYEKTIVQKSCEKNLPHTNKQLYQFTNYPKKPKTRKKNIQKIETYKKY